MARPHRIDFEGARHHVMNRGARHGTVFLSDVDRNLFLLFLARLPERFGIRVHAFALLSNHFHLLLESPRANLSQAMKFLTASYVRHLNDRYDWDGPIFRERFRSRLVMDDAHWLYLPAYIHMNSVRAGIVDDALADEWNSHRFYVGAQPAPSWLTVEDLLAAHGGIEPYRAYVGRMQEGAQEPPEGLDLAALWRSTPAENHRPRPLRAMDLSDALAEVVDVTGVSLPAYGTRNRGQDARARWLAAWWVDRRVGCPHRLMATQLKASPEQVCRWVARVERDRWTDPLLRRWTDELGKRAMRAERNAPYRSDAEESLG